MTKVLWDQVGQRTYEAGCDRAVLYLPDATAVAWNGMTSFEQDFSDTTSEGYYLDGVKYLHRRVPGDFSGTLKALTYPDEFLPFDGVLEYDSGIYLADQNVSETFGLSYRTKLGNDQLGLDYGYKVHLLYNLTATPTSSAFSTQNASPSAGEFSWKLNGIPIQVPGFRPMVHVIVNSTKTDAGAMAAFEDYLYGTDLVDGSLPEPSLILEWFTAAGISEPLTDSF